MEPTPSSSVAGVVLGKAVVRAADALGLRRSELAQTIGVSEATISRLARGRPLEPTSKEGELSLLLVRLLRGLEGLLGADRRAARRWMAAWNDGVGGVPADLVLTVSGLVRVVEYVDAFRGVGGGGGHRPVATG